MKQQLLQLYRLLSPRDRRNAAILFGLMIVAAMLEVVGVAAIPAFVAAVIEPERLAAVAWVDDALSRAGIDETSELLVAGASLLALLFTVKTAFLIFNHRLQVRYALNRRIDLSRRMLHAYLAAPYPFHLQHNRSELLRNVEHETNAIAMQVMGGLLQLGTKLTILIAVLALLFVVEPLVTVFWLLLFGVLVGTITFWFGARLRKFGRLRQIERKRVVQTIYQALGGLKEARVLGRERFFADRVDQSMRRLADATFLNQTLTRSIPPATELAAVLGLLALVLALFAMGRPTESIVVTLSLFVVGLVRLRETMSTAMTNIANLRYHLVSVEPVYAHLSLLKASRARRFTAPTAARTHVHNSVELRDVTFSYEGAKAPALKEVRLKIPAGSAVGFVGPTGAGKSTLIDVTLGLLQPTYGAVLVDGVDIRQSGVAEWQRAIGYVPQSIYLLDDTLRSNVALGLDPADIDEQALWSAIRAAQLEPLIARLPDGLDSQIGEHGVRLSGGERQRIGIARALYHDPDVLVLDEATSSLDNTTERAIVEAVDSLKGRRTVLIVAHRLSTVRNCDTLYYLKNGRIEGHGSFDELQGSHADFAAMAASA